MDWVDKPQNYKDLYGTPYLPYDIIFIKYGGFSLYAVVISLYAVTYSLYSVPSPLYVVLFTSWYDVSHALGFRGWGRNSIKNHSLTHSLSPLPDKSHCSKSCYCLRVRI